MSNETNFVVEKIIRSNRQSISVQVTNYGTIIIKAPKQVTNETINEVILEHKSEIEEKLKTVQSNPNFKVRKFVNGEEFLYLGESYKLQITKGQKTPLILKDKYFYLSENYLHKARKVFISWYKKRAFEIISDRVDFYSLIIGYNYNEIKITDVKTYWGICHRRSGNLYFDWKLIMAPLPIINYVVVHELVHLEVPNHSKKFWEKVRYIMPDYEKKDRWLDENGHLLYI